MNFRNLLVVLLFTVASFLNIHTASASTNFSDLKKTDYFYNQVQYLVEQNVISGFKVGGKTLFKPNQLVTRAEVATMVVKAKKQSNLKVTNNTFKDVPNSAWYADNVNRAVQLGYMDGIGGSKTEFKPNDPVSRQEMAKILSRVFDLEIEKYESLSLPFKDVEKNLYYKYISAIYYNGYGAGVSSTEFSPRSNVTRATFSVFMSRGLNPSFRLSLPVEKVKVSPTDKAIGKVKVNTNGLNVRASADFSQSANNKMGTLSVNTVVDYFEEASSYYKINYNGYYGYIYKTYASIVKDEVSQPTTPPASSTSSTVGYATVNNLNVRASASDSSGVLGTLNRGNKVNVQSITGNWAKITYNNQTGYVFKTYLKFKNTSGSPIKNRIIILDPGHGGRDSGAPSKDGKTLEKNIVLTVSNKVKKLLEADGAIVYATRTTDVFPSLDQRVAFAKEKYGEIFVSIHVNSATNTTAQGTETYHSITNNANEQQDEKLATYINSEIVKNAQMKDRRVKREDYRVIKMLTMPSVLVELGFISNSEDLAKLRSEKYLDIYARSIYNGIVKYYSN